MPADLSENLTLPTPALGIAHVVAEHFAGHEACAARRALQEAAEGYRARAQLILDSRGANGDPLPAAIRGRLAGLRYLHLDSLSTFAALAAVAALEVLADELSGTIRTTSEQNGTEENGD